MELEAHQVYTEEVGGIFPVGHKGETVDGRIFRFALDEGTGIVASILEI